MRGRPFPFPPNSPPFPRGEMGGIPHPGGQGGVRGGSVARARLHCKPLSSVTGARIAPERGRRARTATPRGLAELPSDRARAVFWARRSSAHSEHRGRRDRKIGRERLRLHPVGGSSGSAGRRVDRIDPAGTEPPPPGRATRCGRFDQGRDLTAAPLLKERPSVALARCWARICFCAGVKTPSHSWIIWSRSSESCFSRAAILGRCLLWIL
jgi:hypothetical protein